MSLFYILIIFETSVRTNLNLVPDDSLHFLESRRCLRLTILALATRETFHISGHLLRVKSIAERIGCHTLNEQGQFQFSQYFIHFYTADYAVFYNADLDFFSNTVLKKRLFKSG